MANTSTTFDWLLNKVRRKDGTGGGGGGTGDGQTIAENASGALQTIGFIDANTGTPRKIWVGTRAQYDEQQVKTLHPDWIAMLTDEGGEPAPVGGGSVIDDTEGDKELSDGDVYIRANGDILKKGGAPGLAGIKWSDAVTGGETVLMLDEPVAGFPFDGTQGEIASFISVNGVRMVAPDGSTEIGYGIPIPFPSHGASDYAVVMAGTYGTTAWGWGLFTKTAQDYWYDGAKEPTWGDAELVRSTGGDRLLNMAVSQEKVAQYDGYATSKADLVGGKVPSEQLPKASVGAYGAVKVATNTSTTSGIYASGSSALTLNDARIVQDIDARANHNPITPPNLDYAVRSVSPLITAIPEDAVTPVVLPDASATTNNHSYIYVHAPNVEEPLYSLPAVKDKTIAHEIVLHVFFLVFDTIAFVDSAGNAIPVDTNGETIGEGEWWTFLAKYIPGDTLVPDVGWIVRGMKDKEAAV